MKTLDLLKINEFKYQLIFVNIGMLVIPGGAGGTVFGGYIIKRFRMRCARIMKWETIFTVLIMLTIAVIFVTCEPIRFAGVNEPYRADSG